nr:PREDICTED: uncharacterized protein LOC109031470 [Bemisia tabaci]
MPMRQWLICVVVAIWLADSLAQTFQYSHGWTSGKKRSGSGLLGPGALSAASASARRDAGVDRDREEPQPLPYDLAHDLAAAPPLLASLPSGAAAATLRRLALEDGRRVCRMILSIAESQNCFKIKEDFFRITDDA